jgi:hypothetical protein
METTMQSNKIIKAVALGISLLAAGASTGAFAASLSASGNLVCASVSAVACVQGPTCIQGTSKSFELPSFMFIDFKKQVVRGIEDDGVEVLSPVKTQVVTDREIILQGTENDRGWTLALDRQKADMSLTVAGPDVDFIIFGACTAL